LYMSYTDTIQPLPDPVPAGGDEGLPFLTQNDTWARIWTYRRSLSINNSNIDTVVQGEISNQVTSSSSLRVMHVAVTVTLSFHTCRIGEEVTTWTTVCQCGRRMLVR
jgi:hypothetical protein